MFELENLVKAMKGCAADADVPITLQNAQEAIEQFKAARTALRRIVALDDKNIPKYAKQIAEDGLRLSH